MLLFHSLRKLGSRGKGPALLTMTCERVPSCKSFAKGSLVRGEIDPEVCSTKLRLCCGDCRTEKWRSDGNFA